MLDVSKAEERTRAKQKNNVPVKFSRIFKYIKMQIE